MSELSRTRNRLLTGPMQICRARDITMKGPEGDSYSDTGVRTPRAIVDWVGVTFDSEREADVLRLAGNGQAWEQVTNKRNGYERMHVRDHVKVHIGGTPQMGVSLQVAGTGCRQLEAEGVTDWISFVRHLIEIGGRFSRLDIAFDDVSDQLSWSEICKWDEAGWRTTRFRNVREYRDKDARSNAVTGSSLVYGSGQSDTMIRIYLKSASGTIQPIVRVEIQFRKGQAQDAALLLLSKGMNAVAARVLWYLDFKMPGTSHRKDRWATQPAWEDFLGGGGKLRLSCLPRSNASDEVIQKMVRQWGLKFGRLILRDGDAALAEFRRQCLQRVQEQHQRSER